MRFLRDEKGSAIVIVTLAMSLLLGVVALVIDVGLLYLNKTRLEVLVDSAALAGAQEMPKGVVKAQETAKQYALNNGAKEEELVITGTQTNLKLQVTAKREVNFLFGRVLGLNSTWLEETAVAQAGYSTSAVGVAPLGIEERDLIYGQEYTLKTGAPPTLGAGEFGALVLADPGADDYEKFLTFGFNSELAVGKILTTQTGNISNPTVRAIENRLLRDTRIPKNTFDNFERDAPQILLVPIYVPYEVNQMQIRKVKITGFAAFFVTNASIGQGNANYLKGYFVETLNPGDSKHWGQKNYGVLGVKLVN